VTLGEVLHPLNGRALAFEREIAVLEARVLSWRQYRPTPTTSAGAPATIPGGHDEAPIADRQTWTQTRLSTGTTHWPLGGGPQICGDRDRRWLPRGLAMTRRPKGVSARFGPITPTGFATFASVRRCRFRLGGSRSSRSSASSVDESFSLAVEFRRIQGGCASSRESWVGTISALTLR
jgi:hypothetical protein